MQYGERIRKIREREGFKQDYIAENSASQRLLTAKWKTVKLKLH